MEVTESGIVIENNFEFLKALSPIVLTVSGMITLFSWPWYEIRVLFLI